MELNLIVQAFPRLGMAAVMFGIGLTLEGAGVVRISRMSGAMATLNYRVRLEGRLS